MVQFGEAVDGIASNSGTGIAFSGEVVEGYGDGLSEPLFFSEASQNFYNVWTLADDLMAILRASCGTFRVVPRLTLELRLAKDLFWIRVRWFFEDDLAGVVPTFRTFDS